MRPPVPLHTRVERVMGTAVGISTVDEGPVAAVDDAFAWLRWVDETFSTYRADSEIMRIDRDELALDDTLPEVRHVISRCRELEAATGGRFTAHRDGPKPPALDPSGFVKGWSIDEAAMILRLGGIETFMINAGGDILCVGHPPGVERWPIGIQHPFEPAEVAAVISLPSGAIATSGTYARGEHIWGRRTTRIASATVVGPDLATSDALATAVFVDPDDLAWMTAFRGYDVVVIGEDRRVRWTAGLDGRISVEPRAADPVSTA